MPKVFARYVAPARARPGWWRLILGMPLLVATTAVLASFAVAGFVDLDLAGRMGRASLAAVVLAFVLYLFGLGILAAGFVARFIHRRSAGTLFGPPRETLRDAIAVGLATLFYSLLPLALIQLSSPDPLAWDFAAWAPFAALILPAIVLQCTAEEVVFRGYLVQELAARVASPNIWAVLPALAFAMLHYDVSYPAPVAWSLVATTFIFAMLATDLVVRTGNLGAAIGFHISNNVYAILIYSSEDGEFASAALWRSATPIGDPADLAGQLPFELASLITTYFIARLALWAARHEKT